MVYDFHGNFSKIYPISKDELKSPDRSKWGYYWDFEDYLIEGEDKGGLSFQGFLITNMEDLNYFSGLFQRAFSMTLMNAKLKNFIIVNYNDFYNEPEFENTYLKNSIEELSSGIDLEIEKMEAFMKTLKSTIDSGIKVWVSLNTYWTTLTKDETSSFWSDDTEVIRLPDQYLSMTIGDFWHELDELGPIIFNKDMLWEDFSYMYPNFVRFLDPEIIARIDTDFLRISSEYGLL